MSQGHASGRVDVIVPVYDALEDVRRCLDSVLATLSAEAELVVVNDASGPETTQLLRRFAEQSSRVRLLENPANLGYTRAANVGLRYSSAPHVVLLNSDTLVSAGWLEGLLRAAASRERVGVVGPLSNAASWQSVPDVLDVSGKFAVNPLPPGTSVSDMADLVASCSSRRYPSVPFLNGFCLLIERSVIDTIGSFDEQNFPLGYGEENDFCVRARDAGFALVVADDVYVYHAKSKSYGVSRRDELAKAGAVALKRKHGAERIDALVREMKNGSALRAARAAVARALVPHATTSPVDMLSLRILFILPVAGGGGGAHSVVQEAAEMRRLGMDVRVAVKTPHLERYRRNYQEEIPSVKELFVGYEADDVFDLARGYDVVVATAYTSVEVLESIVDVYPNALPAYYVQDYEPFFFESGSAEWHAASDSYARIPSALLFAKTEWIANEIELRHGLHVHKVAPSLDHAVYFPTPHLTDSRVAIVAMIRPQTARRGAERTLRVLAEVARRFPHVAVHTFGCDPDHAVFAGESPDLKLTNHGRLTRSEVASLLRTSDVFVDLSDYQAFGRTGLEAMACGCVAVLPRRGGVGEYADAENAVLVDTSDEGGCVTALTALVENQGERRRLRAQGLLTAARFSVGQAAMSELSVFAAALARHRSTLREPGPRIVLLPAVDSGGPNAAGWLRLMGVWRSDVVRGDWQVVTHTTRLPAPRAAPQIAIFHADSPVADASEIARWVVDFRAQGGRLVVDMEDAGVFDPLAARSAGRARRSRGEEHARWLAQHADAVLVSSTHRASSLQDLNGRVFVVPNGLAADLWQTILEQQARPAIVELRAPLRLGLLGAPDRYHDVELVASVVSRLVAEYGQRLQVEVIGVYEAKSSSCGERVGLPRSSEYPRYLDWLRRRSNWDIALLPLRNDRNPPIDLDVQWLTHTALGAVAVGSEHPSLRELIKHGRSGLLVSNDEESWYRALKDLIDSHDLRQRLLSGARDELGERIVTAQRNRLETLAAILAQPARTDEPTVPPHLARGPSEDSTAERVAAARRKLAKLRRDPRGFFGDSKSPLVRGVGSLVWGSWRTR